MKSAKQNYITIGSDGTVLPQGKPRKAAEPIGESADVAYRLARMAEEAAASLPIAPNAHDAADAADYTAVPRALATAAPRTPKGAGGIDAGSKPVALVMARPKTAKRLMQAVGDAGFAACAVYTQDHRGDSHIKLAQSAVSLGEKYSDALFCNGHAVLTAIDSCGASVVLLCDEALPLAEVDSFLARTAARGVRVFRPLSNDAPLLGWVLCTTDKPAIDGDSWRACPHCGLKFDGPSLAAGHYVCPACGGYLRMSSSERIDDLLDADSFVEWNRTVPETDPLEFPGYLGKLEAQREKTGLEEGVRTGVGRIAGLRVAIGIMESQFFMGSMGSVVGEKVARLVERATDERLPVVVFTASGGARMQEGLVSLMQMAKVSCALERHAAAKLPYISVLTDPTTGGVTASFAMQGDVILAEPRALIGFAGQRVIRDTIKQELPEGFQTAEFALDHGLIDAIVERGELRSVLAHLLALHLATASAVRGEQEHEPGDRDILVSYEAVRENLASGTDTYNTVTYGDLTVGGGLPFAGGVDSARAKLRGRMAAVTERFDRRGSSMRKRLEKALSTGGFDAEAGVSLEDASAAAREATAPTSNRAWESVQLARNVHRPTALAYIDSFVDGFIELHGDRMFGDDGAVVCGLGWIGGRAVTVIAQEKGRDLKERIARNFGCPQPEGYRKSIRLMRQAEKFGRPIITFVDTPGAYPGLEAEEHGQGEAIARTIELMSALTVPTICVITGEGGSGGALALAVGNRVLMLENAVYSVLSPEGFASILWKDASRSSEACEVMKLTAQDLKELGVIDAVVPEPAGGAHENPEALYQVLDTCLTRELARFAKMSRTAIAHDRYTKFRAMGASAVKRGRA